MIHSTRPALVRWLAAAALTACCGVLVAYGNVRPADPARVSQSSPPVPHALGSPVISSKAHRDPRMEARISELLRKLTLEQKVAQRIKADIRYVTPDGVKTD